MIKVYQYGIKKMPDKIIEPAFTQLALQNRFWNALVEIDNASNEAYQRAIVESDTELSTIKTDIEKKVAELEKTRSDIKAIRQRTRSATESTVLKLSAADFKTELKDLRAKAKALREKARVEIKPKLDEIEAARREAVKAKRQEFAGMGLYWGNYNAVVDSYNRARSAMMKKRAAGKSSQLNFHRFTGEGRLTVQIMNGMSVSDLFSAGSQQLQIDPVPAKAWDESAPRSERRRLCRATGRLRVGSEERDPVWLEFQVVIHRPIPELARIKMAQVSRWKVGNHWRYRLNITVDEPDMRESGTSAKAIGIDTGWRKFDNGIRVAAWKDSDGGQGELRLDSSYIKIFKRLDGLQSTIDKHFEAIKARVSEMRQAGVLQGWLAEKTDTILRWRSSQRMSALIACCWESNAEQPEDKIYHELLAWRKQYLHLYEWQSNLREKMQLRRRDKFRIFAKWLAENYGTIVIEDFKISNVLRKGAAEYGVDTGKVSRYWEKVASPGLLLGEIERSCAAKNAVIARIDAKNTTNVCPHCKNIIKSDTKNNHIVRCGHCELDYDQDFGAAEELLSRYFLEYSKDSMKN